MTPIEQDNGEDSLLAKVAQFEKFTALLMERLDIKIIFDGVQAYTDGKEIHLPNLLTLTEKEIDFLYGILLHEAGHVKFTDFSTMEKVMPKITTHNQMLLANAIEDARIENKMMSVYAGAPEIFSDLYNVYASDNKYMEKIFKFKKETTDWLHDFGTLVHNYILDLPTDSEKMVGKKQYAKVAPLLNKVKPLIDKHKLTCTEDSYDLTFAIYDVLFKQMKDNSQKTDFAERQKAKEESEELLKGLMDEYNSMMEANKDLFDKLRELRSQRRELSKQLNQFTKKHKKELKGAENLREKAEESRWEYERQDSYENYIKQAQERSQQIQQDLGDKFQKQMDKNAKLEELRKKMEEAKTDAGKERIKKSIASQERMLKRLQEQIEQMKNEKDWHDKSAQDDSKRLSEMRKNNKAQYSREQVEQMMKDADLLDKALREQMDKDFNNPKDSLKQQIQQQQAQAQAAQDAMHNKMKESIQKIDKALKQMGMDGMGLIPEFKENGDWKESDGLQQGFDKQASKQTGEPCVNGMSPFGHNPRNMVSKLVDVSDKLNEINLAEVFHAENHDSLLDSVNEEDSQQTNTRDNENGETFKSTRRHIPVSTAHDVVRDEIGGANVKVVQEIRTKQSRAITNLTNVFKQKFRFKQKPKFKSQRDDGTLDARDLYKIPNALSTQIFEERLKNMDSKVQVAIALDISGSMDKEETQYGEKLREVAVVLSDALNNTHVKHEVIGFGAPVNPDMQDAKANPHLYNRTMHNLETIVYRKLNGESGLGNIQVQPWDNSDGESIRVIGKRMLKERKKKKILFVVSDNKPFLTDSDIATLDQDLREAIKWAKKNGIDVYGIGWNNMGKDFYGEQYCKVESGVEDVVRFMDKRLAQVK